MKRNIRLFIIMSLVLFILGVVDTKAEANSNPKNISGDNRVKTSIEISKMTYKSSDVVILAGYTGQVDSLSGTLLAHDKKAPVIYATRNKEKLDDMVLNQIKSLGAKKIYILGGENVISKEVEESLSEYEVIRLRGDGREETAINIAKEVMVDRIDEVFLTARDDISLSDALAVGPVSGKNRIPIFLTRKKALPEETKDALRDFGVKRVTIIGGNAVIDKAIENEIKAMGITVKRVWGNNRIETALNIANEYNQSPNSIVIANGWEFADAVVGGYLAAKENAPILLTKNKVMDITNLDYIADKNIQTYTLGGEKVIRKGIFEDISLILNEGVAIKEEDNDFAEPFKIIKQNDSSLPIGKETVKRKGVEGIRRVIDRVYYKNGQQIRRQNISNTLIKRAIDEIVLIGTKK